MAARPAPTFRKGAHVLADFGSGYVIAHVFKGAHENAAGETKHTIQAPDGSLHDLAHREAPDVVASGGQSGLTFKTV